ncbi:hypothetical protein UNDYM_1831 [Undibacterium sp. YM2]|nr:hypothetical protein UNDYM_1831 [Undibacterium sp. YM2]
MPINLTNKTGYQAYFTVLKGDLVVAERIELMADATVEIPTSPVTRSVVAETVLEDNIYTSAPLDFIGAAGFLAQVKQVNAQGTYNFELIEVGPTQPNQVQFQKTCLAPVVFSITGNGKLLQSVFVNNSFETTFLNIAENYTFKAVVNGITTEPVQTNNPEATISAVVDTSSLENGYFTLVIS